MTTVSFLPFAAAALCAILAVVSVARRRPSPATWFFSAGMIVLAADSLCTGQSLRADRLPDVLRWLTAGLTVKSFVPVTWLGFSLTYSRGHLRGSVSRWGWVLAVLGVLPVALALAFNGHLVHTIPAGPDGSVSMIRFGVAGISLNVTLLVALVLILTNLEQTFRAAVGTMRWRLKFVVLGLGVIFGAKVYVRSQAILFSAPDLALAGVESSALLIGCLFLVAAYARSGWAEVDVYPSRAVLRSSLTVVIVGSYLFLVGVLAQIVKRVGGVEGFQFQAFVVLLGMAGLAVLLLSDRLRQRIRRFVGQHFGKAQHDSVRIWTDVSRQLGHVHDRAALSATAARLISGTFDVLSVTVWLRNDESQQLVVAASTAEQREIPGAGGPGALASSVLAEGLGARTAPFDLEGIDEPWAEECRRLNPRTFPSGGHRWCVPLRAGEECLGVLVLADRVNGVHYSIEETELLQCIADQMTSVLLNLRLADELARSRELEAFRTMSAFFVHDLKNAAASLNLMLKNLPIHFDDPAFREDALRGVGNTARRIDDMIARLSAFRQRPAFKPVLSDLNELVTQAVDDLDGLQAVALSKDLAPIPAIMADHEQVRSVVTNLLLNARDALGAGGRIELRTRLVSGSVMLLVADNGCGMSPAFLKDSLFRPFQSTKTKGLGIGMFQARMIVEAHGGSIQVESQEGLGTTVRISLPVAG